MSFDGSDCPLCLEPLDSDDVSFFPCPCLYQVCRFCWAKLLNEENGLCPACRQRYDPDAPVIRAPQASNTEIKRKPIKRKKEVINKLQIPKETFNLLPELRVIQTNLVFVVGLPQWISKDKEILKGPQYFGQFGKVYKVEVNANQTFTGSQGQPSISAYITYDRSEDAMRAVLTLDQFTMHGRQLRVSLGTTKYCSQFLRGHRCNKHECMYLHGLGDPKASFTKEQMHAGKHMEYMKTLLDDFVAKQTHVASTCSGGTNPDAVIHGTSNISTAPNRQSSASTSNLRVNASTSDAFRSPDNESSTTVQIEEPPSTGDHVAPSYSSSSCISFESSKGLFYSQRHVDAHSHNLDGGSNSNMNTFADIDFDPIRESQVGLAELMASEQPSLPQASLATQTFSSPSSLSFAPPPGFENFPVVPPEDIASLMAATSPSINLFDSSYGHFAQVAAATALTYLANQQQQQQQWNAFNGTSDLDFLTRLLRQAMQIDDRQPSLSIRPSNPTDSTVAGDGDFKFYISPSTSATATILNNRGGCQN